MEAKIKLPKGNWEERTHRILEGFLSKYASPEGTPACKRHYAVLDCDDTITFNDSEYVLDQYALSHLRLALPPEAWGKALTNGIPASLLQKPLPEGYSLEDLVEDAVEAYRFLYRKGYVQEEGGNAVCQKDDPHSLEFRAKAYAYLLKASELLSPMKASLLWAYPFAGFHPQDYRELAKEAHRYHANAIQGIQRTVWTSPNLPSRAGVIHVSLDEEFGIVPEMRDLLLALRRANIDVYIVSASTKEEVDSLFDPPEFALPSMAGVFGVELKEKNGVYLPEAKDPALPISCGPGKSDVVSSFLCPRYEGRGPSFVAGDGALDFYLATEFKDTRLVLHPNVGKKNRSSLLKAVALDQAKRGYDLENYRDTLYLLQGRDYPKKRFLKGVDSYVLGQKEPIKAVALAQEELSLLEKGMDYKTLFQQGDERYPEVGLPPYRGYHNR